MFCATRSCVRGPFESILHTADINDLFDLFDLTHNLCADDKLLYTQVFSSDVSAAVEKNTSAPHLFKAGALHNGYN